MRHNRWLKRRLMPVLMMAGCITTVGATVFTWINASGDGSWGTAANWDPPAGEGEPGTADQVVFDPSSPAASTLDRGRTLDRLTYTGSHATDVAGFELVVTQAFHVASRSTGAQGGHVALSGNGGALRIGSAAAWADVMTLGYDSTNLTASLDVGADRFDAWVREWFVGYRSDRLQDVVVDWRMASRSRVMADLIRIGWGGQIDARVTAPPEADVAWGSPEQPVGNLWIGYNQATSGSYNHPSPRGFVEATNWTLNIWAQDVRIGLGVTTMAGGFARLALRRGSHLTARQLLVGRTTTPAATKANAEAWFEDAAALRMGTGVLPSERAGSLWIGYSSTYGMASGRVDLLTGAWDAYLNDLVVGHGNSAQSGGGGTAVLNLAPTNFLVVSNLWIGRGTRFNGRMTLPAGGRLTLGTPSHRTALRVAYSDLNTGYIPYHGDGEFSAGPAAEVIAYLSELRVGQKPNANLDGRSCRGEVNCTEATVTLDISGDLTIGYQNPTAAGRVALGAGTVDVGGNLYIGGASDQVTGLLELDGTRVGISNAVVIAINGTVSNRVYGTAGGLSLTGQPLTLHGGYHIEFRVNPAETGPYWGLRWRGDRVATLETFRDTGRLTWDVSALRLPWQRKTTIYYDPEADWTYAGIDVQRLLIDGSMIMIK